MIKKLMLALGATVALSFGAAAQKGAPCASDEFHKQQVSLHPQIVLDEQRLNADIERILKSGQIKIPYAAAKGALDSSGYTAAWPSDVAQYHIPMVVHIIYEGATTSSTTLTDNDIYGMVTRLNTYYNATDPLLSGIIPSFKPYTGNAHVTFHLATKDPNGKPTHGIVRQYSYASNNGDESAKIDQWPPDQYLNLYLENVIGRGVTGGIVLAYATFPSDYSANIYSQGVISRADQASITSGGNIYTIAHEIGHFLSLYHTWNTGVLDVSCGDDEVDDTPPTTGHFTKGCQLYDTLCATGYYKDYDSVDYYHMTELTGNIASNRTTPNTSVTFSTDSINIVGQSFTPDTTDYLQNITVRAGAKSRAGDVTSMSVYNSNGVLIASSTNTPTVAAGQTLTYTFAPTVLLSSSSTYRFVINRSASGGGSGLFTLDISDSNKYAGGSMYGGTNGAYAVPGSDLYFIVKDLVRNVAANTVSNTTVRYNSAFTGPNVIGQTITVGTAGVGIKTIKMLFSATSIANDSISLSIYDAAGTLVETSDTRKVVAGDTAVFTFQLPVLTANKTYKLLLNRVSGSGVFSLLANNTNPYPGGVMYSGANAGTAVPGTDLYFDIAITRLRRFDYPDTTNTQNIMDYSSCNNEMFSKGQVARMRATLRSDVGNRYKLISDANLVKTGITDAGGAFLTAPDITPTALFSVNRNFTCKGGGTVNFTNRSYNDTIASATWNFDKSADTATSRSLTSVNTTFNDTGWVTATLTVTGNGNPVPGPGSATYTRKDLVYVADNTGIAPYVEDFNPSNQLGKFPIFNYFDNPNYRWELYDNAGFFDKTSIRFKNYDVRDKASVLNGIALNTATQSPRGLFADFITPAYNLADPQFANKCFLSFFSAGAFRTNKPQEMNDSMMISYSTNCGQTWSLFPNNGGKFKFGDIANNGYRDEQFVPGTFSDWREQSIPIPASARTAATFFRFRYSPGTDNAYLRYSGLDFGTGNNFYIDRLAVTNAPLSVQNGVIVKLGMSVRPNPTSGAATIRLNGGDNSVAEVNITDVTGKLVFRTSAIRSATTTEIEIPATAIAVKGMYLVHVVTNGATETQKLIVY